MGDSLSTVFMIIMAGLLMFFFPMLDSWERQDDLSYMAVYTATVDLVDAVRNTGVLTKDMYESYLTQLYGTCNTYDVTLEHRAYKIIPDGTMFPDGTYGTATIYLNHYSSEIEKGLYGSDGYYPFNKGDYFYVSVKNTNKTQATMLKQTTYGTNIETFTIGVPYGGQVKSSYES